MDISPKPYRTQPLKDANIAFMKTQLLMSIQMFGFTHIFNQFITHLSFDVTHFYLLILGKHFKYAKMNLKSI